MSDPNADYVPWCCDYRDHGTGCCTCPNHERSDLHPFGHPAPNDGSGATG